jgi:aryl sulfotransferase
MGEFRRYHSFGFDSFRWRRFRFRPDDIVISTPAKSGTTWMQMMCALLIFQETSFDQPLTRISPWLDTLTEPLDSVVRTLDEQTHRRFIKSHLPFDGLPRDLHAKYICVGRDPRDVAVSWTHHEANIDLERLINLRIDAVGLDDLDELPPLRELPSDPRERFWYWVDEPADRISPSSLAMTLYHLATFWSERAETSVALFHYGDMSRDLDGEMRRLAAFLEIDVPHAKWDELVEAASFANMRARAKELTPEVTQGFVNADTFFRRGSSGEWREFIQTDDDQEHYEARVAELADPELAHWVHSGWVGRRPDVAQER